MPEVSNLRRRFAPVVLVAGLVGGLVLVARSRPEDTEVTVRFDGDRGEVRAVEYAFTRPGDVEPLAGATVRVSPPVPPKVRTTAHLSAGSYDVTVSLEMASGARSKSVHRVDLQGSSVVLPVTIESP